MVGGGGDSDFKKMKNEGVEEKKHKGEIWVKIASFWSLKFYIFNTTFFIYFLTLSISLSLSLLHPVLDNV